MWRRWPVGEARMARVLRPRLRTRRASGRTGDLVGSAGAATSASEPLDKVNGPRAKAFVGSRWLCVRGLPHSGW